MTDLLFTNTPSYFNGVQSTSSGKFNPAYADYCAQVDDYVKPNVSLYGEDDVWVQFDWYWDGTSGSAEDGIMWEFYEASGASWIYVDIYNGATSIERLDSTGSYTTEAITLLKGTLVTVDIHIVKNPSGNSTLEIYQNEALAYSFTGARQSGTSHYVGDLISIGGSDYLISGKYVYMSNLRVSTIDTRGRKFSIKKLSTVGTYDEFSGGGFAALIDDTQWPFSDTAGDRESGTLDYAAITDNGAPAKIVLQTSILADASASPNSIAHFVRDSATNYDQTALTPTAGITSILSSELTTNPDTGLAWEHTDLNGMEFGLVSSNI